MRLIKNISILLGILFSIQATSQILKPVKWSNSVVNEGNGNYTLVFEAKIDKTWHIYALKPTKEKLEIGPIATELFLEQDGFTKNGKLEFSGKEVTKYDEGFEVDVNFYEGNIKLIQKIKADKPVNVLGYITYQTCDDSKCLPPEDYEFEIDLSKYPSKKNDKSLEKSSKKENTSPSQPKETDKSNKLESENTINTTDELPKSGGIINAVEWKIGEIESVGNKHKIKITANIEPNWHLYGTDVKEGGPLPTSFVLEEGIKGISNIAFKEITQPKIIFDPTFKMEVSQFENQAVFELTYESENKNLLKGEISYMTCDDGRCVPGNFELNLGTETTEVAPTQDSYNFEPKEDKKGLLGIFIASFIGGLIALLTPCVFPMIPLTVSFFTKNDDKGKGILQALLFGLFIILIYVILGLALTVGFGAETLNEMSSNRIFNIIFFALFLFFAFSFFGAYEISLPSSWSNKADQRAEKGGLLGVFFVAFTLVLVSFSCTGPIIGTLLVTAAVGGGYQGPAIGMLGFSLALALPFTLFAIFPSWMQKLPKSGGWLNSVKVVLGFIELALAFKFLVVPDQAYHWGILKREYFLALWIVIFFLMGMYLLGKLKFSHDSDLKFISVPRLLIAVVAFSFSVYMIPGLWGAPVQLLSGIAPPWHDNEGFINHLATGIGEKTDNKIDISLQPTKYTNVLHPPYGITAYFDYDEALRVSKALNKPVLLDFTGHACTNCRKIEESVWRDPQVINLFNNEFILTQLYVDDRTNLSEEEQFVSEYSGKKIKTIGKKFSELQARLFATNSQPYYVILDSDGNVLNEPRGYDPPTTESYLAFLKEGLERYKVKK